MTTITALPVAPTRGDPATFAATADTFLSALPTFGTECNAVASEMNQAAGIANSLAAAFMLPGYRGTSTSSITFGTGTKVVTTQNNLLFVAGMSVTLSLTVSATSYMQGTVTSYSGTTLTLNITSSNASGTYNDWQITPTNTNLVAQNGPATVSSLNGGQLAGMRNRFINGCFTVNQRYGSTTAISPLSGVAKYICDRWAVKVTGSSFTSAVWQVASDGNNSLYISGASGVTSAKVYQRIEAINCYDLSSKTVTLSTELRGNSVASATWELRNPTATDNYTSSTVVASGTFSLVASRTLYTTTVTLPAGLNGLEFSIDFGALTSGTGFIYKAQLELGSQATPFEQRSYSTELALCQRYYFGCAGQNLDNTKSYYSGMCISTTGAYIPVPVPVPMRTLPSLVSDASSGMVLSAGSTTKSVTGYTISGSPRTPLLNVSVVGGLVDCNATIWTPTSTSLMTGFDAEL